MLLFLYVILSYLSFTFSRIISLLSSSIYERPYPNISFINEHFSVSTFFNTYLPYSVIQHFPEEQRPITSFLMENNTKIKHRSDISIKGFRISNFSLYFMNPFQEEQDFGISLYPSYEDESFSFLHRLYRDKYIEHLSFAFEEKDYKGYIHFGGIPNTRQILIPFNI